MTGFEIHEIGEEDELICSYRNSCKRDWHSWKVWKESKENGTRCKDSCHILRWTW